MPKAAKYKILAHSQKIGISDFRFPQLGFCSYLFLVAARNQFINFVSFDFKFFVAEFWSFCFIFLGYANVFIHIIFGQLSQPVWQHFLALVFGFGFAYFMAFRKI